MNEEVWRDIEGYEGLYQVSNWGRVKSLGNGCSNNSKERILRTSENGWGYLFLYLWKNGKRTMFKVHRLVLMAFNPFPDMESLLVNHKDENKLNNRLENLEWCTYSYNNTYNDKHKKIGDKQSIPIVQLSLEGKYIRSYKSSHDAAREGGYNQGHINDCCKGRYKTHGGYKWCYLSEFMDKYNGIID